MAAIKIESIYIAGRTISLQIKLQEVNVERLNIPTRDFSTSRRKMKREGKKEEKKKKKKKKLACDQFTPSEGKWQCCNQIEKRNSFI